MAFVVITESADSFRFEGQIGGTKKQFVFKSDSDVRIAKTDEVQAIMREDLYEEYVAALAELRRLKYGDPESN